MAAGGWEGAERLGEMYVSKWPKLVKCCFWLLGDGPIRGRRVVL